MIAQRRVYEVIRDHPKGIYDHHLVRLAEIHNPRYLSGTVCRARRYCDHGYTIEGFTTRTNGVTQTKYKIVRDWNVSLEQKDFLESEAA